jgi:hypothetical protein
VILAAVDAAGYLYDAGFRIGQGLVYALAVFKAESSFDTQAQNTTGNSPPSTDRGWIQINSYWHPEVTDACAYDPGCAAKAAWTISKRGTDFGSWAAWNNGAWKAHIDEAWAAADAISRVRTLQGNNSMLAAQLVAATAATTAAQQKATDLAGQVAALQGQLDALTADDKSLQALVQAANDGLAQAQKDAAAARAELTGIVTNLDVYLSSVRDSILKGGT